MATSPNPQSSGGSPFASRVQKPIESAAPASKGPSLVVIVSVVTVIAVALTAVTVYFVSRSTSTPPIVIAQQPQPQVQSQPVQQQSQPQPTSRPADPLPAPAGPPPMPSATTGGTGAFGLLNGNMAEGGVSATGWSQVWVGSGRIEANRDTSNFRSGPASLRLTTGGAAGEGQVAQLLQLPNRVPFNVGGWVMSSGNARVTFGVQFYDASNRAIQFSEVLFTDRPLRWTNASLRIEPPSQATSFALVLYIAGNGQAWLDDVTLAEAR